jgi:flagellar biosynthesis protein FlhB
MADTPDKDDKTEEPTARRLERARQEGDFPLSPEVPTLAVLAAAGLVLALAAPALGMTLVSRLGTIVEQAHLLDTMATVNAAMLLVAAVVAPFLFATIFASALATLLQSGFELNRKAITPDFKRLNPMTGFGRAFGVAALGKGAKSVIKVLVVGTAGWLVMADALPALENAADWSAAVLAAEAASLVLRVLVAMLVAQALIAIFDVIITRFRYQRRQRMTRTELRDESKEMDGDPHVKARMRSIRMQRARRRMLAEIPKATVVITNPTHYAVALAYARDSDAAPRIVAKGVDTMAARIREIAAEHGIPLVANPPLARALYPHELDRAIPAELFQPVAEIIAYVWGLRSRAP